MKNNISPQLLKQIKTEISASDHLKQKLYNINSKTLHTKCGRRIIIFHLCVLIMIVLIAFPGSVYASSRILSIMRQKASIQTLLKDDDLEALYYELQEQGYTDAEILELESLRVNKNGLTYGPDCLGADLILVTSDQGDDGYVYRDDLEFDTSFKTPEEALLWQEEIAEHYINGYSITVYECDGETMIGTFTLN